ncbi:16817_t:CDS:2 [Entrophospora sp. SA101]|nr:16817_t:CDS:2 [Entrophospora sp. SA101]
MDWKSIFLDRVLFQTALKKPDQNHFPKVKSNSFIGVKALFVQNRIKAYDDFQDGTTDKLADYTVYNALINAAEAWSNVSQQTIHNCWLKTGILPERTITEPFSINDEDEEKDLEMLLEKLPNSNNLSANEYIHVEDENVWTDLTDEDIIEMVNQEEQSSEEEVESMEEIEIISNKVAKESVDTVLKYLYQQGPEFGEVGEEVKILRGLNRRIGLVIQKNLKQTDLNHYFEDKMIE